MASPGHAKRDSNCLARTIFLLFLCLTLLSCVPAPKAAQEPLSTYLTQAETLIAERRYGEAVKTLEEAAQVYPDTTLPLLKIGQIYLIQHRWLLAEDAFNRALARDLDNPVATAGLAEAVLNQGDLLRALDLWREATELNPDLPGVFTGLGRTHLFRFEFEAAKEAFLKQQAHQPDPEAQWHLAALEAPLNLATANEYLLAIPHQASPDLLARRDYLLATLVPFTTDSPPRQVAKATGIAMAQVQHWPLAAYALTIAKENFEDSLSSSNSLNSPNSIKTEQAETLSFLGHALAQAGRPALELFEQAQTLDPNSALPLFFYGIYLRRQGALNAGEALFNQAVALDPDNAAIQIELAQTNVLQGDFGAAETHYTLAETLAEDDLQIQVLRVRFYANRGYRLVEAGIPAVEDIIEADENNAEAHDLLGWMQFLSGEPGQAEKALRRALELDPDLVSARYHLARHLAAKGQSAAARAEYQRVIDWDTSGVFRERALKELQHLGQ